MAVKLICASHSPLMEFASPQEKRKELAVREAFDKLAAEVKAYDPTFIISFIFLNNSKSVIYNLILVFLMMVGYFSRNLTTNEHLKLDY